jgi:two-component system NtrC family sensor kinase
MQFLQKRSDNPRRPACRKIVQSLLSFARQHQPERKLINLNQLIDAAVEILNYDMRTSNIQVMTTLDSSLPQLMADPHQLQQVFLNIINNARQAMEAHQPNGSIRIKSEASNGRALGSAPVGQDRPRARRYHRKARLRC